MPIFNILTKLITVLPRVRTKIQLTGLVTTAAVALILQLYSPGNIPAILCGGMIGVSIIIFGQLFHFLTHFPKEHRAVVFLVAFGLFCAVIVSLSLAVYGFVKNTPSADVTLFQETLPDSLMSERLREFVQEAKEKGTLVQYNYKRQKDSIKIYPSLPFLNALRSGGPIYPIWMQGLFFPVPVLSIKVNNPTDNPIFVSEIVFQIRKREPISEAFPLVEDLIYDDPYRERSGGFSILNVGWGRMTDVVIQYKVIPMREELATKFGTHVCCVPPLSDLAKMDGIDWQGDFPFKTDLPLLSENESFQSFEGRLSKTALERHSTNRIGILYGILNYREESGEQKRLKMLCRVFYHNPGGPGRINPHYLYNVRLDPVGGPTELAFPISESVDAHSQEHFLLSVFTEKSALTSYDVLLHLTSGEFLEAGSVNMRTFYPRFYGGGEGAQPAGQVFTALGPVIGGTR